MATSSEDGNNGGSPKPDYIKFSLDEKMGIIIGRAEKGWSTYPSKDAKPAKRPEDPESFDDLARGLTKCRRVYNLEPTDIQGKHVEAVYRRLKHKYNDLDFGKLMETYDDKIKAEARCPLCQSSQQSDASGRNDGQSGTHQKGSGRKEDKDRLEGARKWLQGTDPRYKKTMKPVPGAGNDRS
ncbi:MAG: hypothetical protein L6R40_002924 [Gallowayella cf. fulva]|nr:MAG: hypothetical protein L6R40_002924 [Xanthomendoza cf. fulva]